MTELMKLLERLVTAMERIAANGQAMVAMKAAERDEVEEQPAVAPVPEPQPDRTPPPSEASSIDFPDIDDSTPLEPDPEPEPVDEICQHLSRDGRRCVKPAGHDGKHYYGKKEATAAPEKKPVPMGDDPFSVEEPAAAAPKPAAKTGVTYDELVALARDVISKTSMPTVRAKITPFGVEKLAELDEGQYDAAFAAVKSILDE